MAANISKSPLDHNIAESIFVSLTDSQKKERQKTYFDKFDRNNIDLNNAVKMNWYDRVEELLRTIYKPPLDVYNAEDIRTELINSAVRGDTDMVKLIAPHNIHVRTGADLALKIAFNYGFPDIAKIMIPYCSPDIVAMFKRKGYIKECVAESIFVPVTTKEEYEARRNQAGADIVFAIYNQPGMRELTSNIKSRLGLSYDGSSDDFIYFRKRIPYAGHRELAEILVKAMDDAAGKKIVSHWNLKGFNPF